MTNEQAARKEKKTTLQNQTDGARAKDCEHNKKWGSHNDNQSEKTLKPLYQKMGKTTLMSYFWDYLTR